MAEDAGSFASRWSRRKTLVREGRAVPELPVRPVPVERLPEASTSSARADEIAPEPLPEPRPEPPPTLADVAGLNRESNYARFVAGDVTPEVKNAALKKLFSDPQFNVMDRLDTYIDDYNTPDPLPASWLRKMTQAAALGLFDDEVEPEPAAAPAATASADDEPATAALSAPESAPAPCDENTDLRLQPDHAAGCAGPEGGAGQDARREH